MKARMRTIISLDDELHRRAKFYAAEHGTTLTALVEEALRFVKASLEDKAELLNSRSLTVCQAIILPIVIVKVQSWRSV
jgi:hypothetical protein